MDYMSSIAQLVQNAVPYTSGAKIVVPAGADLAQPSIVPEQAVVESKVSIGDPARAVFEARAGLAQEANNGVTNAQEVSQVGAAQADNSAELVAKQLKEMGIAMAASLVDAQDKQFISVIAKVLDGVECNGSGVTIENHENASSVIGMIQDIYVTAKESKLGAEATSNAIYNQLKSLGLSQEQKIVMQDYLKQVVEKSGGDSSELGLDWMKNLALSKEGMLAVGTALYVFSNLISQIPFVGSILATPIQAVQGLLGMAKDLIPMALLIGQARERRPAPVVKQQAS